MSLDYNLGQIKNYKEICYSEPDKEGFVELHPVTHAIIWTCIAVELNGVKEDNIDEWVFRQEFLTRLGKGNFFNKRNLSREELMSHIGLSTNVSTTSRLQFLRNQVKRLEIEINNLIKYGRL